MSDDEDLFDLFKGGDAEGAGARGDVAEVAVITAHVSTTAPPHVAEGTSNLSRVPRTSWPTPTPAPATGGGLSVIHSGSCGDGTTPSTLSVPPSAGDALKVHVERCSGIRVRRVTRSFEQLAVRVAECPFVSFAVASGALKALQASQSGGGGADASAALAKTCVGVVVRKTDPKQSSSALSAGGASTYAVCTLWNMRGVSPPAAASSAEEEMSFLLCGIAFDMLYGQLAVGSVVALSQLRALPARAQRSGGGSEGGGRSSLLLKVANTEDIRLLGFAADLGTCEAVARNTGEHCHALVNRQRGKLCAYHLSSSLRAGNASSTGKPSATTGGAGVRQNGLTTTMHIGGGRVGGTQNAVAAPTAAAGRPCGRVNAALNVRGGPSPSGAAAALAATRLQTQRLMNQQGFLTVSGASGLPLTGSGPQLTVGSVAQTVYGTVQHGPLAQSRPTDLQLPTHYPSAKELGVSSRGRDVLEATKQMESQRERERLLRQALRTKSERGAATAPAAVRATPTLAVATAMGRKRERAAERQEVEEALRARKRPSRASAVAVVAAGETPGVSTSALVEEVRRQFAPLHRSNADEHFVPMTPSSASAAAVVTGHGSAAGGGTRAAMLASPARVSGARQSAVVATVAQALRSNDAQLLQQRQQALAAGPPSATAKEAPFSLLSAMAGAVTTSNDALIREAELHRVREFLDGQIQKEAALQELERCHEQLVKATFCYGCREWFSKLPAKCTAQRHRVERKETVRRFYSCECCGCKMAFLGEETKPWKLMPRCPRCNKQIAWEKSNAAPEVAGSAPDPMAASE